MRKRTEAITWRLVADGNKDARTSLVRILRTLSELTGLSFSQADPDQTPSLDILVKLRPELIQILLKDGNTR